MTATEATATEATATEATATYSHKYWLINYIMLITRDYTLLYYTI